MLLMFVMKAHDYRFIIRCMMLSIAVAHAKGVPFNQLTLCASATWKNSGDTIGNSSWVGSSPNQIFIDIVNTIYITIDDKYRLSVGVDDQIASYRPIFNGFNQSKGIFVSSKGDIFVDNGAYFGRVEKWTMNGSIPIIVMTVDASCHSLFLSSDDILYCSLSDIHQVVAKSLNTSSTTTTLVAGACSGGSDMDQLYFPHGIFVTDQHDLYVADCGNNRVQMYKNGQWNGYTIISNETIDSLDLRCPTSILFDNYDYMYILERDNHRIIRSDMKNYRCIIGCSGTSGNAANQLNFPSSFSFDRSGHLWVIDRGNSRLQKFLLASNSCHLIHNFPRLSSCARWDSTAIAWANRTFVGNRVLAMFIDTNNSIYAAQRDPSIRRWFARSNLSARQAITSRPTRAIFVASNGDIYVDNGDNGVIDRWRWNSSVRQIAMMINHSCYGIFLDTKETLYCSLYFLHRVVKKSYMDPINASTTLAGNGTCLSELSQLCSPAGLFVDLQFNIYIADCGNHRVIRFRANAPNGTVVAGAGAPGTIDLNCPISIVLDYDGYLYISESGGNRLIGSGPFGFRCIASCTGTRGSSSNQLSEPYSLSFDSHGNLFVCDAGNSRIQHFVLAKNHCLTSYNQPMLCPNTTWNSTGLLLADNQTLGNSDWMTAFVNINNTIYIATPGLTGAQVRYDSGLSFNLSIPIGNGSPRAIFADYDGNIYVDDGLSNHSVTRWSSDGNRFEVVMIVADYCYGLFVDVLDNVYCSLARFNRVIRRALNGNINRSIVVAGNGNNGSTSYQLSNPRGIFVDQTLNLYVADCFNDRIQMFKWNQQNGTTIVGNGTMGMIQLHRPTAVILDGNGYLFIADNFNKRIIASGPFGFRCIINCFTNVNTAFSSILNVQRSLHFDTDGHLIVMSSDSCQLVKFHLSQNICNQSSSQQTSSTPAPSTTVSSTQSFSTDTTMPIIRQECHSSTPMTTVGTYPTSSSYMTIQATSADTSISTPILCVSSNFIGSYCNISTNPCDILQPCLNNGTCYPATVTSSIGYVCSCLSQFNGTRCENDHRACQPKTCWNQGVCETTTNKTFKCRCVDGWEGVHCESRINYCQNVKCFNDGICFSLYDNYTCQCLGDSYSGRHCEIKAIKMANIQLASKSLAFIAIITLITFALWIVIMDILKYVFHIDLVMKEKRRLRREKFKKRRKFVWAMHYIYTP